MSKPRLLIVDDDPGLQKQLKWCFEDYDIDVVGDRKSAIDALKSSNAPVVTLDLGLPPDPANASEGLATLSEILAMAPHTKVIVVSGNDDREVAINAVAQGAYDFYEKPVDPDVLRLIVERAHRLYSLEEENRKLSGAKSEPLKGLIAGSREMMNVCLHVEKIAPTDTSVLLNGSSGTGKEILARAIHELSDRAKNNFVAINCAAIPENLLESELFGYEKGAFTGATKQTKGKFEYSDGGTLFLDEMGDLPLALQAKLLRFLQERSIERVGGRDEISVDTRVVCATHKDIHKLIELGEFREDLYYRISEVTIAIPSLAERAGDAILIGRFLLKKYGEEMNKKVKDFSPAALAAVEQYRWPGNVRELENRVKRAVIMADGQFVEAHDLELDVASENQFSSLKEIRERAELDAIQKAIAFNDGQIGKAAEMLQVSRPTVYHLLKKYNIEQ